MNSIFKTILRTIPFLLIFLAYSNFANNHENIPYALVGSPQDPPFISESGWVDSVLSSLSPRQRIAQLFMIPAYSNQGDLHKEEVARLIRDYQVGGIILFQGGPGRQIGMINYFQSITQTPLLTAIDGEWGLGMRLDSVSSFPRQMMMGAIQDEQLLYDMGAEIARQFKRVGIQVNFAPVIDVNNNPKNPVINSRSFGEQRANVASKGYAYMAGMQKNNVIATAKHFPGHGDTDMDSHYSLPVITHSRARLDSIELYPFKELIANGLGAVMTAHLNIPALDDTPNSASSISHKVVTDLLQDSLGFKGLIFTDALGMQGVSQNNQPGELEVKALIAGNDILLMPADVGRSITAIELAITQGRITQDEIDRRCKKILQAKYWVGAHLFKPLSHQNLYTDLENDNTELIHRRLVEASITLLQNKDNIIPFKKLDTLQLASISIGSNDINVFQKYLQLYDKIDYYAIRKDANQSIFNAMVGQLARHETVIVSLHNTSRSPSGNFGITPQTISFVQQLAKRTKVILVVFANPYSLSAFAELENVYGLVMGYEDTDLARSSAAQILFGGIPAQGRLPVTVSSEYPAGFGIVTAKIRFKYSIPREVKMNAKTLERIDSIVISAIKDGAFPGCQIVVARHGVVCYNRSFGYHTYEKKSPVLNTDLYDLASLTKITATLPALMKLYDEGSIDINDRLAAHLPALDTTNKNKLLIKEVLSHYTGLEKWIPFYLKTLKNGYPDPKIYSALPSAEFSVKVAEDLYIRPEYRDTMYNKIYKSSVSSWRRYRYSDVGFYLFQDLIETITKTPLDIYVDTYFYRSLGAYTLCYNPLNRFDKSEIPPTEQDNYFRKQLVQGYIHDYGAAMLGGVAGHAGLFSNANDLAKMMQMYLQKGEYGGERYLQASTIDLFTRRHYQRFGVRRALGFDRSNISETNNVSYGHTGFTGTVAWVDPVEETVFVFLSNRVYPDAENWKILDMGIRTKIQEIIAEAIED